MAKRTISDINPFSQFKDFMSASERLLNSGCEPKKHPATKYRHEKSNNFFVRYFQNKKLSLV